MGDQHGSFEERLRAAREQQGLDKPAAAAPSRDTGTNAMGLALRVGVELVASLAVGLAIGWALDRWLGTTPWLLGLFVVLGGVAGVANLWRMLAPRPSGGMGSE
jgi:ATP synthase protein I